MDDLAHWDFAEQFTGCQAAALILGIEPSRTNTEWHRVQVVINRMALSYEAACERFTDFDLLPRNAGELESLAMMEIIESRDLFLRMHESYEPNSTEADFFNIKEYNPDSERWSWKIDVSLDVAFDRQEFSRKAIAQWLKETGFTSIYQFDKGQEKPPTKPLGRWPWGNYHTEALGHLEAAVREFWVSYDPARPKETAPKNDIVAAWLESERGVSPTLAGYMASILRADDLPTGPRK